MEKWHKKLKGWSKTSVYLLPIYLSPLQSVSGWIWWWSIEWMQWKDAFDWTGDFNLTTNISEMTIERVAFCLSAEFCIILAIGILFYICKLEMVKNLHHKCKLFSTHYICAIC